MGEGSKSLRVATRVLMTSIEQRKSKHADVETLHSSVLSTRMPDDDLACGVIQQVLEAQGRISDFTNGAEEHSRLSFSAL